MPIMTKENQLQWQLLPRKIYSTKDRMLSSSAGCLLWTMCWVVHIPQLY